VNLKHLSSIILSDANLNRDDMPALEEQLRKLPDLLRLDISLNPELRLLTVGILRIAARLESFNCDGCSLLLPPQSLFSLPEKNPRLIQHLFEGKWPVTKLNLSAADLTRAVASDVAAVLQHFLALEQLNISSNPDLGRDGVSIILSSIAGACCILQRCFACV
jgi:hypothetical protein